jgi:BirA family biotin operon repressor/biotin-[acetyl-CoA-carboxylase] ligase
LIPRILFVKGDGKKGSWGEDEEVVKDDEILRLLKEDSSRFLSGQEISRRLKVTRTAVWKRVNHLRALGYKIESLTRSGYRLIQAPDLLTPSEIRPLLTTKWMGRTIHYFQSIDSTNSKAYQLALQGAKEGEVVIAESQVEGKGRLGRRWFSPSFLNLYLSLILRPPIPPHRASLITLMAAVATADAIQNYSGLLPQIKWPNDVLLRGRKVAGLLNEIQSEMDRIHFVILGIGVNLNMDAKMFPKEIRTMATSLKREMEKNISRKDFLLSLLAALEIWYATFLREGDRPVLEAWRGRAKIEGKRVNVSSFGENLSGVAVDIDSDGALILETEEGELRRIVAGDVEYSRELKMESGE